MFLEQRRETGELLGMRELQGRGEATVAPEREIT